MKKKTIALLLVASLLALPAAAAAATEFTLGGYIKLHAFWDSAAIGKNINAPPLRNDNPNASHGRFNATAQSSRFNFTIKGPDLWGAVTTGYLEIDFDSQLDQRQTSSHSYVPRLRHAFFRMNWPETEVLLGQYWSMFCEFYPEMIHDGPFQGHGQATARLAQARVSQVFALGPGKMTVAGLVGKPTDTADSGDPVYPVPLSNSALEGQTSEMPQFQAKVHWEGDLWGKAGFYGRPRGFAAQVIGGWQRSRYRAQDDITLIADFLDEDDLVGFQRDQQYKNNWKVQGTVFIPVLPTATENLAGTAALTVQAYIGQGLGAFGNNTGMNSYFGIVGFDEDALEASLDRKLVKNWGGYVQGNYYFNNEWFVNAAAGLGVNYGVSGEEAEILSRTNDVKNWWEANLNLYYRPITAFKFGLGYTYTKAKYYRGSTAIREDVDEQTEFVGWGGDRTGDAHRVQFAGWFFF